MKIKIKKGKMSGIGITFVLSCIAKVVGALYRIPLIRIVGAKAMGEFSLVFPIYAFAVTLIGAGITVNVARLIIGGSYSQDGTVKRSSVIFAVLASVVAITIVLLSRPIEFITKCPSCSTLLKVMSISLPFSTFSAVLRGYFQGKNQTLICGISYCIEPLVKTVVGLSLAPYLSIYGIAIAVSVSEVLTTVFLFLIYQSKSKETQGEIPSTALLVMPALKTAIGSAVLPLSQFFDGVIVLNVLTLSMTNVRARELLGIFSTVTSLMSLPSLAINALLSSALNRFCDEKKRSKALLVYGSMVFLVLSVFCSSIFIFAPTVITNLYPTFSANHTKIAINLIKVLAPYPLFFGLGRVLVVYLQGKGKFFLPSISVALGVLVKTATEIFVTSTLSIYASALGALLSNATAFIVNFLIVCKIENSRIYYKKAIALLFSPIIFAIVANAFTYYSRSLLFTVVAFCVSTVTVALYLYAFVFTKENSEKNEDLSKEDTNERYIRAKTS